MISGLVAQEAQPVDLIFPRVFVSRRDTAPPLHDIIIYITRTRNLCFFSLLDATSRTMSIATPREGSEDNSKLLLPVVAERTGFHAPYKLILSSTRYSGRQSPHRDRDRRQHGGVKNTP